MSLDKPRIHMTTKVYKGVVMFENEIEKIENMETREDDVWVCSFPRSGTTLTQELVYLIMTGDFEKVYNTQLDARFPIIEIKDERFPYYKGVQLFEDMDSPRLIKSHLHHFLLPEQLRNGKGKIIYISRNPKDLVTSFYRLLQWGDELQEGTEGFSKFVDAFVSGTAICCPWPKHVLQFWERRNDDHILFLKYDDVIKDLPHTVRKIADFLKKPQTDDDVKRICEYCHIDNMRNNPMCNGSYWREFKHVNDESEGRFINKGKPGVWKEVLTPEMTASIDELMKELDGTGLEL